WMVPGLVGSVAAVRLRGGPGTVNGTTVLLTGDGSLFALRSLTVTTVKAYCVPYSNDPDAIVISVPCTEPIGDCSPPVIAVTAYDVMRRPCPFASGQVTVTLPSGLAVAVTEVGGSGTSRVGVTGLDLALGPAPILFSACTVNV